MIFSLCKKNRNPFVDHPELVERISSFTSNSVAAANYSLVFPLKKIMLQQVKSNDTIIYIFPLASTANKTLEISNLRFSNSKYSAQKSADTLLPGESGFLKFTYISSPQNASVTDTLTFTVKGATATDVKIPITIDAVVGIDDLFLSDVKIYPNPIQETLYIDVPENAFNRVEIYNMLGEQVLQTSCVRCQVNTATLQKGVYIVKIQSGAKVYTKKVIKQ